MWVAIGIHHAIRMRHIIICGRSSTIKFTNNLKNSTILKQTSLNIKCVSSFSTFVFSNIFIPRRIYQDMIENVYGS